MATTRPITKKQLAEIVADYATEFPEWTVLDGEALFRDHSPIRQMIWFQKLRWGAYRPMHSISALPLPIVRMLPQMLDVRNREAKLGQHDARRQAMAAAMEREFWPPIRKPIDIAEVVILCEAEARDTTNDLAMLAILYAWLGRAEPAIDCCNRMQSLPPPKLAPVIKLEEQIKTFGRKLVHAIETGTERQFIKAAMKDASVSGSTLDA